MELKILKIEDKCTGCGACISVCPKNALSLQQNDEGFYFPVLDESACINCRLCEKICQVFSPSKENEELALAGFMAKAKDRRIVSASSSGGAFSILSEYVLSQGGVVYGARYDFEKERLIQDSTSNCSIEQLRKSKYIESYTGSVFRNVGQDLLAGLKVLYVGTPCQTEGLTLYLKTKKIDRGNLILVRLVCHGVPSNKFFAEYKHYEEKKFGSKMISFDFRPKIRGWRNSDWKMKFSNGKTSEGPYVYYYYYYYYYQKSNNLRRCCYDCKRVLKDSADLTIGDFWGIGKYRPENKDNEGISLIMAHTHQAEELLKNLDGFQYLEEIPLSAVSYIRREVKDRSEKLKEREDFMAAVKANGYMRTAKRDIGSIIFMNRLKGKIKKIIRR